MSGGRMRRRCCFSLRSLILGIVFLSVFLAATLSGGRPRVMFRFSDADGGAAIYAHHYGWPIPYLVVPTGDHAGKVPADVFVPGLIVDFAIVAALMAAVLYVTARLGKSKSRSDGMALAAENTMPKSRSTIRRLMLLVVGTVVLLLLGIAAVQVAIELDERREANEPSDRGVTKPAAA